MSYLPRPANIPDPAPLSPEAQLVAIVIVLGLWVFVGLELRDRVREWLEDRGWL